MTSVWSSVPSSRRSRSCTVVATRPAAHDFTILVARHVGHQLVHHVVHHVLRGARLAARTISRFRFSRTDLTPIFAAVLVVSAILVAPPVHAQGVAANKSVRTLIGDIALILRSDRPGTLRIGVAGATRALALTVRATDARRWADSASKLVAPMRRRAPAARATPDTAERRRAVLEEPGVGAGTFVLLRIDSVATRHYLLFVDDGSLEGIRQPLEPDEAALLIRLVRRAASPPRATAPAKKRSAAKRGSTKSARPAGAPAGATSNRRASIRQPSTEISSSSPAAWSAGTPVQGR